MLEIGLLEDQTITISQHQENKKQTKNEEQAKQLMQPKEIKDDDSPNPLDGLDL